MDIVFYELNQLDERIENEGASYLQTFICDDIEFYIIDYVEAFIITLTK